MKLLLVEDHAVVRSGFRRLLTEAYPHFSMGEAATASEAIDAVRREEWEIIVLDISLPGRTGLDLLVELRELRPATPILMMTMYGEEEYAARAFRAGAAGYVTKGSAPDELLKAVKKVLAGGRYVSPGMAELLAENLGSDADSPKHEALSTREFQVFRMLAVGLTIKGIGHELHLSPKTVSTYRSRVLQKMQMRTSADLIRYAHRERLVE